MSETTPVPDGPLDDGLLRILNEVLGRHPPADRGARDALRMLTKGLAAAVDTAAQQHAALKAEIAALRSRLAEAEQRHGITYRGVWRAGEFYAAGHVVTHEGSAWHANSETKSRPGGDKTWTLMVKRGRDGR